MRWPGEFSSPPGERALQRRRGNGSGGRVESLEIRQRTAVVLYYYNQMSTREIAKATGLPGGHGEIPAVHSQKELEEAAG